MFEPTMLPTARSWCPLRQAMTQVVSSGRLVARATIVSPMSPSVRPSDRAIPTAPTSLSFPPPASMTNPISNSATAPPIDPTVSASASCPRSFTSGSAGRLRPRRYQLTMKSPNHASMTAPPIRPKPPGPNGRNGTTHATSETTTSHGSSLLITRLCTAKGQMRTVIPRTSPMLAMLEPTMLPKLSSPCPPVAAITLKASSGALVPMATIVRPTTSVDTPSRRAIVTEPATSQ